MPEPLPIPEGPFGLLISRDLFFNSRVTSTAQALGARVTVAGNAALAEAMIAQGKPRIVLIDLGAGDLVSEARIAGFKAAGPDVPFVAFGSHVDTESLAAARKAGCDEVMPRSKFTMVLPDLIRTYLPSDTPS